VCGAAASRARAGRGGTADMGARTMWKAVLVVGKHKVPVDLFSAVADRDVRLHLLHGRAHRRVKQRYVDPTDGKTVESDETRRGIEVEKGRFVVLDPGELAALEPEPSREIEVVSFVPHDGIDHRWYERPYYLGPGRGHAAEYFALARALEQTERCGFARWTMRKREYAGALRVHDGYLALVALRHAGEVVVASELQPPEGRAFEKRELALARQLVDALAGPFEHASFRDEYHDRLQELIERKRKGKKIDLVRWRAKPVADDSLVGALERSIEAAG
jgi:DNA end-binding protein Ku